MKFEYTDFHVSKDNVYNIGNKFILKVSNNVNRLQEEYQKDLWISKYLKSAKPIMFIIENNIAYYLREYIDGENLCLDKYLNNPELLIDLLVEGLKLLHYIKIGGITNLDVYLDNICNTEIPSKSFEVVTMLEVLEHIPNVFDAVKNAVRISKKFIIVTVPSKEDDNPEHIHLLTKDKLTKLFNDAGVYNLKFGGVNGHLFLVARK